MRIVLMLLLLTSCAADPVGRRCDLGASPPKDDIVIAGGSLDCVSRLCLGVPGEPPMCTNTCATDDDCPMEPGSPCHAGFTCAPALRVGTFACTPMCVCKDALDTGAADYCSQREQ